MNPTSDPADPTFLEFLPRPVPQEALERLHLVAQGVSGGGQAARAILFWLGGENEPTGYSSNGGLDLQRLDARTRQAAVDVINWWALPEHSEPLYEVLEDLRNHFNTPLRAQ